MSAESLDERSLPEYLREAGILAAKDAATIEPAGDGNINWVRRVSSGARSWIVKQARPALERFPEYRVSTERIVFEARFYERVRALDADGVCPRVLHFDPDARVLVLEDLGDVPRLDHALAAGGDGSKAALRIGRFLGRVHVGSRDSDPADWANDEMRRLHGDHIFSLPFRENNFPLSKALRERAEALWADTQLVSIAAGAYRRYLEPRGTLVHGDVQAGNVLLPPTGARLLDAEIAHLGDPAFDLGTLFAHLLLPAAARGEPAAARPALRAAWRSYQEVGGELAATEPGLYAAIEMLRRTIGAARVPVVDSDPAALRVLGLAEQLMRDPAALDPAGGALS